MFQSNVGTINARRASVLAEGIFEWQYETDPAFRTAIDRMMTQGSDGPEKDLEKAFMIELVEEGFLAHAKALLQAVDEVKLE